MCDLGTTTTEGRMGNRERDESKLPSLHLLYYHEIWLCSMCKLVNFSALGLLTLYMRCRMRYEDYELSTAEHFSSPNIFWSRFVLHHVSATRFGSPQKVSSGA